ncbi:MAG TPA: N-acetyl-gamma-glutamyl-phosphate reductase [Acidimicrobiales bacterium]|nr:N-acetyl-gamma-glutamyl-phosphate reductase [Acidimicrobiales bacterium]
MAGMRVGVVGASGYAGAELLRLCAGHPSLDVAYATADANAGTQVADLYPSLAAAYPDTEFVPYELERLEGLDVVFLTLPHGQSQRSMAEIRKRVPAVVDLGADFRLRDPAAYRTWYGEEHAAPEQLDDFVYGIPELAGGAIAGAPLVAAAGCYVTAASLALGPLVRAGLVEPTGIIVDAASGVSGAGRALSHTTHFGTANEDFTAYGLVNHRHTPEIEQAVGGGAQVLFTPHLAPMTRGVLATCYARPIGSSSTESLIAALDAFYDSAQFVVVSDRSPSTKATYGSNACHLTARYDDRTGWVIVLAALDNLVKGASGQMIQCANLMLGLPEAAGLTNVGVYP